MITDKDKAAEIANNETLYGEDPDENSKIEECYIAAIEMAKWKNKQIKEAIESLIAEIDCKAQQNMPSSTKAIYVAAQLIIKEAMNTLKQKLNLED